MLRRPGHEAIGGKTRVRVGSGSVGGNPVHFWSGKSAPYIGGQREESQMTSG